MGFLSSGLLANTVGKKIWGGDKKVVDGTSSEDKDRIRRMKEIDNTDRVRGQRIRRRSTALNTGYDDTKAG